MKYCFKYILTVLSFVILLPISTSAHFWDMHDSPHQDAINIVGEAGYIHAAYDDVFLPNAHITREDAAFLLANALKLDVKNVRDPKFKDVPKSHPYYKQIAALKEANIISGYNGLFTPSSTLTRGQMAKMIAESYNLVTSTANTPFTDANNSIFKHYIAALYEHNITKGKSATLFGVNDLLTRGEMATFVVRAMNSQPQPVEMDILLTASMRSMVPWMPKLATLVEEERKNNPDLLLMDAGNAVGTYSRVKERSIYRMAFEGQTERELMQYLDYDVQGIAEEELYLKDDTAVVDDRNAKLKQQFNDTPYPVVFSNPNLSSSSLDGLIKPYITTTPQQGNIYKGLILDVNGEKIGVLSLMSTYHAIVYPIDAANEVVQSFKNLGINKIIALSGFTNVIDEERMYNERIAKAVPDIDLILTTTRSFEQQHVYTVNEDENGNPMNPTYIVGASEYLHGATKMKVAFDQNGDITQFDYEVKKIDDYAKHPDAQAIVYKYTNKLAKSEEYYAKWITPELIDRIDRIGFLNLTRPGLTIGDNSAAFGNLTFSLVNEGFKEPFAGLTQGVLDFFTFKNHELGNSAQFVLSPELSRIAASRAQLLANIHDTQSKEVYLKAAKTHLTSAGYDLNAMAPYFNTGFNVIDEILLSAGDTTKYITETDPARLAEIYYNRGRSLASGFESSPGHRNFYRMHADGTVDLGVAYAISESGLIVLVVVKGYLDER